MPTRTQPKEVTIQLNKFKNLKKVPKNETVDQIPDQTQQTFIEETSFAISNLDEAEQQMPDQTNEIIEEEKSNLYLILFLIF